MRGDGRIFRKGGSRYWHMAYWVNGHQVRASTGETEEARARRVLRRRIADVLRGAAVAREHRVTLGELLDALWTDYQVNGRKWLKTARYPLRHLANFFGVNARAHTIATERIQRYVQARQEAGAASATINLELALLRRAFVLAVRARHLMTAPFIPKLPTDPASVRQGFFTREEIDALAKRLPDDLTDVVQFLFFSAWRIGEVRSLEWRDYDRVEAAIRLRPDQSKTKHGRILPVAGEIAEVIARRLAKRRLDCPFIFHRDGVRLGDFRKTWNHACAAIGLSGRIVHDLRRSGVKHLIGAGVDPHTVMAFSGHRTNSMLKRYHIIDVADLRLAAERASAYEGRAADVVRFGLQEKNRPRTGTVQPRG